MGEIVGIGSPIAVTEIAEMGMFFVTTLMMGLLGVCVTRMAQLRELRHSGATDARQLRQTRSCPLLPRPKRCSTTFGKPPAD